MKVRPMPVIRLDRGTRVTHQSAPWRNWVTVRHAGRPLEDYIHVFDPPFRPVPARVRRP